MGQSKNIAIGLILGGLCIASLPNHADSVDLSIGSATVSNDEYDGAGAAMVSYSFIPGPVEFTVGVFGAAEFKPEHEDTDYDSYGDGTTLDVGGGYLSVGHEIELGSAFIELHGGVAFTETEARIDGVVIGEDDTTSPMGNVAIGYKFNKIFGAKLGVLYVDDVSDEQFTMVHIGTRWTF